MPLRYDLSTPESQRKLAATERYAQLATESGLPMIHLAIAFVLEHPAVTSAIVGPRTMDHLESQLGGAEVRLTPDILDEIDTIVPPGITISRLDHAHEPPAVLDPALRRRRRA